MRSLRELFNSYATPPTEEETKLLDQLDGLPPVSAEPGRGEETSGEPTSGG